MSDEKNPAVAGQVERQLQPRAKAQLWRIGWKRQLEGDFDGMVAN